MGVILLAVELQAQNVITVSGVVIDELTSEPLPGVNIGIVGTSRGTSSNTEGLYTLEANSDDILVFSYIGYETQEIPINDRTEINTSMVRQEISGDEIVVVGYGTQTRESLTGSISSLSSFELERTPALNTSERLVGMVQGITARQADARPGAGASIQIRNMGDPLFVIDGVPASHDDFNLLGRLDIESISILKDASAAIYGLRASNGVVLVETKKGNFGRQETIINVSSYYGVQEFTRFPQPANAYQYQRAKVESDQNRGNPTAISPEELENWRQGAEGYRSYDYKRMIMNRFVPEYNVGLNVSGGAENVRYYIAVNHAEKEATMDEYLYNRSNIQANVEGRLSERLTIGTQIRARRAHNQQVGVPGPDDYNNPILSVFAMWPTESPYANDNPNYIHQTHNVNVNPATYKRDVTGELDDFTHDINGRFFGEFDFEFGLNARATYSYGFFHLWNHAYEFTYDAYRYNEITGEYFTQPGWGNDNPYRQDERSRGVQQFGQLQLTYEHDFEDHDISAFVAYEQQETEFDFRLVQTFPLTNQIPIQYTSELLNLRHDIYEEARAGIVGRVNYAYKDKYLVELLGRYDGSFLFAPGSRWGFFPGASLGWRITEESFFNTGDVLNDLKIRASYGQTGSETFAENVLGVQYVYEVSDRIYRNRNFIVDPFSYMAGYDFQQGSSVFDGGQIIGTQPRGLPITNLSWITNISKNIGIDASFFDDKLTATFDIFERKREGLPAPRYDVLLPLEVGYSLPNENLNSDANRGIEGSLAFFHSYGDIAYTIKANATFARRRSLSTYLPRFENSWHEYRTSVEDRWNNINWGYQVIGQFQSEEEIENHPVNIDGQGNRTLLPGDFIFKDVNGDGIINSMDERPIGYAQGENPYLSFGFSSSVYYKGFHVFLGFSGGSMQSWTQDREIRNPFHNNGNSPEYLFEDRWHRENPYDNSSPWISGTYPAIREANLSHSNNRHNDFWFENVRYLRLRNLEISYSLPQDFLSNLGIRNLKITARGTNLFTIDNMKKYQVDPEISSFSAIQYPQQRMYSLGLDLTF